MAFDTTIRLKQLNNPEVSGYIINVVSNYLTGNVPLPTGNATGIFYPLTGNPSGFITSGATGALISASASQIAINSSATQTLAYVAQNYWSINGLLTGVTLSGYAQLTGNNTFLGNNTFNGKIAFPSNSYINNDTIFDLNGISSVDWDNRLLKDSTSSAYKTIDWNNRQLIGQTNSSPQMVLLDWGHQLLNDTFGQQSVNWSGRFLIDNTLANSIDWQNRILSGNWNLGTSTGTFVTTGQTGAFSGAAIKVTGSNNLSSVNFSGIGGTQVILSGNYALISGGSSVSTGQLTGAFYPLISNPSGYITTGQTGQFVPLRSRVLYDNSNFPSIDYNGRQLFDDGEVPTIDYQNKVLSVNYGNPTVDWWNQVLISSDTMATTVDWFNEYLFDNIHYLGQVIDWSHGYLQSGGLTTVDWINLILSGNWNLGTSTGSFVQASTWSSLTFNSGTTVWNAASNVVEDKKILVLTGATTLGISGLYNGWNGVLETVQSGSGAFNITLPANTKVANNGSGLIYLTTGISGAIDMLAFAYDGSYLYANIANQYS